MRRVRKPDHPFLELIMSQYSQVGSSHTLSTSVEEDPLLDISPRGSLVVRLCTMGSRDPHIHSTHSSGLTLGRLGLLWVNQKVQYICLLVS